MRDMWHVDWAECLEAASLFRQSPQRVSTKPEVEKGSFEGVLGED